MGTPKSYCSPTEATPGGSGSSGVFVSLMLGMLLCLLSVQRAWALRTSDNHWKRCRSLDGGGCQLSPIVWIVLILFGTVLFTISALPFGEFAKYVWPDQL